jgi:type VI secretion system secreted protein Hcp
MALQSYMKIEGKTQGEIKGESPVMTMDREDQIPLKAWHHNVNVPSDPLSGRATGSRIHHPFTIVKKIDKATPLLYSAMCNAEEAKVTIRLFRPDPTGSGQEQHYFTILLEGAMINDIAPYMLQVDDPNNSFYPEMEKVAFRYERITWTYEDGGITHTDDWKGRR